MSAQSTHACTHRDDAHAHRTGPGRAGNLYKSRTRAMWARCLQTQLTCDKWENAHHPAGTEYVCIFSLRHRRRCVRARCVCVCVCRHTLKHSYTYSHTHSSACARAQTHTHSIAPMPRRHTYIISFLIVSTARRMRTRTMRHFHASICCTVCAH